MHSPQEIVATIVASAKSKLSESQIKDAAAVVEKSGGASVHVEWLAQDKAADIFCMGLAVENLRTTLSRQFQNQPIDILVQIAACRRKKLLVADMESTIIEQEMLDELASDLGFGEETADITRRAMNNELDFATALYERVALLKGQPTSILDHAAKRITFMPGAEKLLSVMKAHGATCWLITGGFAYFADPVAKKLGFDRCYSNNLLVRDGKLTGEVAQPLLDRNSKKKPDGKSLHRTGRFTSGYNRGRRWRQRYSDAHGL